MHQRDAVLSDHNARLLPQQSHRAADKARCEVGDVECLTDNHEEVGTLDLRPVLVWRRGEREDHDGYEDGHFEAEEEGGHGDGDVVVGQCGSGLDGAGADEDVDNELALC